MKLPTAEHCVIYLDTETPLGTMRLAAYERMSGSAGVTPNDAAEPRDAAPDSASPHDANGLAQRISSMASISDSDHDFPALSGAWFLDQWDLPAYSDAWQQRSENPILCQAQTELAEWFAGERRAFDVPLAPQGTPFQQAVWQALLALPFGTTNSYSDLALSIGKPKSVRAAAQAIGRNPISIFIPCHRIIGRDTSLTGFGGGLERKQALLKHEGHRYLGHHPRVRRIDNGQLDLPW